MFKGLKNKLTNSMMAAVAMPSSCLAFDDESFDSADIVGVLLGAIACIGAVKHMKNELEKDDPEFDAFYEEFIFLNGFNLDSHLARYVKDSCTYQAIRLPHITQLNLKNRHLALFIMSAQMEHLDRLRS